MKKVKIAIIHPKIGFGGSEATVLFMIEALKDSYEVFLITSRSVNLGRLNNHYGTNLSRGDFRLITVSMPGWLAKTDKFSALRGRFIQRYCQKISSDFDLLVSAYNPMDFKRNGIQFATDIAQLPEIISLKGWKNWFYGNTLLRKIYLKICDFISKDDINSWKNNITFSNSHWTKTLLKEKHDIDSSVIYPPVSGDSPNTDFKNKENGFLIIGRVVPEKQFEKAIQILKSVRQKGSNVHLHIIGKVGDYEYFKYLNKNFFIPNKDWIFFEGHISESEKIKILSSHKFGISCRSNEPFGIAVAEMTKAGSIVFVPDGGGQTEIVDSKALIYKDIEDAEQKIESVINNKTLQDELREHLLKNAKKFSVDNFKREIKNIVDAFLKNDVR